MHESWNRFYGFIHEGLWRIDLDTLPRYQALGLWLLRLLLVMGHELVGGQLTLRAMSLVYTTLLSMVPLLAVSFSVLKAFGVHNQIEPMLMNFLAPLGEKGLELSQNILGFVENMKVGVLGAVGLGILLYTVISLLQKIEEAFSYVWGIHRIRSLSRRFSDYLSVIMVGPVLIFSALGITASVMNTSLVQWLVAIEPFGSLVLFVGKLMPFLMIIGAFTFIYMFVPNTRVNIKSALVGAVIGGILWQATGMAFASFAASSTRYTAIYSGFAILILFMIWLYLSWFILLFGAQIAYFHQHPQQIRLERGNTLLSNRLKERVALVMMTLIARAYHEGERPLSLEQLVKRLAMPGEVLNELCDRLVSMGFLVETNSEPPAYIPGREPEQIKLSELLQAVRSMEEEQSLFVDARLELPVVDKLVDELDSCTHAYLDAVNLRDLVLQAINSEQGSDS